MDRSLKSLFCIKSKLSPDHINIQKLPLIFTRLEMHPHQFELQSLILILVLQSLFYRCKRDSIDIVPCGILVSSIARAISEPLCTLRVHSMLMRSSTVLQCIGHEPLFTLYVWVYAYDLCICMFASVCVCMCAYKCVDHVLGMSKYRILG